MKRILFTPDSRCTISDHVAFSKLALIICQNHEALLDDIQLFKNYKDAVEQEENIFKWMRKSEHTEEKAEIDHSRDGTYTGVTSIVRVNLKHFDPDIHDAARHVHNLLENYGDVIHANYDAETAAIDSIITHLKSPSYVSAIIKLGLTPWINRLQELNDKFKQYVEETLQEQINKPEISARESRRQTDEALRKIIARIESLANINGKDPYLTFAREFNELVEHYNTLVHEHYGRIHARTDISGVDVDPIISQSYTGKPIFVIPIVRLHKIVDDKEDIIELVFTQDFTIAFKNNIERGTAILVIQGIGKYKGQFVTTFSIK
jgi:hypothetical protein